MPILRQPRKLEEQRYLLSDDPALDFVMSFFERSKSAFDPLFLRTGRLYNMYRGWYNGQYQQFRNNISLPLVFSTAWADTARKANTSFGQRPYLGMEGGAPDQWGKAREQELVVSRQLDDVKIYEKAIDLFLTAHLYGTAIVQTGWKFEEQDLLVRQQVATPFTQQLLEYTTTNRVTTFDGPDLEIVDLLDFFPEPNIPRLDKMRGAVRRLYAEFSQIETLGKLGLFDAGAVRELQLTGMPVDMEREINERLRFSRNQYDPNPRDRYSKPVQILEYYGMVPKEMQRGDGAENRVITIANGKIVLRNRPNPFWYGASPWYVYCPLPDPHYFHGTAKAEVAERLQVTANRFANQKLDALDLLIDPVMAYNRNANIDTRKLYMRAGRLIGMDGPPSENIQAIFPDMRGVQAAYQEIEQLWRWLQQSTGIIEDTGLGAQVGGGGTTAREFLGRQEAVTVRLLLESRLFEEQLFQPVGTRIRLLNRQFLTVPRKYSLIGSASLVDSGTGRPLPQDVNVTLDDLNQDYTVRGLGTTLQLPRAARQQNAVLLLQAASAHPFAMATINWAAFWRQMFQIFEFQNVDELLTLPPEQQMMLAMQMQQTGGAPGGGNPERVPGTPTNIQGPGSMAPLPGMEDSGQAFLP